MIRTAAALALGIVTHASACGEAAYTCEMSSQCVDGPIVGECQPDGFCSFPDDRCASGQRYGRSSGTAAGQCVMPTDAGTAGASSESGTSLGSGTHGSSGPRRDASSAPDDDGSSAGATATTTHSAEDSTTAQPLLPDPLLWFSFDERFALGIPNQGILGGAADCTPQTCPALVPGVVGNAAAFDGTITCAIYPYVEDLALPGGLTIAAWIRRDSITGTNFDGLFTKPVGALPFNSWRLASYGGGRDPVLVEFHVGVEDGSGGSFLVPLLDDTWTHFVGTWDGSTMRLWQDGVLLDTIENSLYEVDEQPVFLGCDDDHLPSFPVHFYTGLLDEVRLYDHALDESEIAQLFALRG